MFNDTNFTLFLTRSAYRMIRRMKFTTDRRIEVVNLERLEIADRLEFLDFETNEISRYREKKRKKTISPNLPNRENSRKEERTKGGENENHRAKTDFACYAWRDKGCGQT